MTRQKKTPRQRAEEQLAIADRAVARLKAKRAHLTTDLNVVEHELEAAAVRRDYLATHPDLQQHTTNTTEETHP